MACNGTPKTRTPSTSNTFDRPHPILEIVPIFVPPCPISEVLKPFNSPSAGDKKNGNVNLTHRCLIKHNYQQNKEQMKLQEK